VQLKDVLNIHGKIHWHGQDPETLVQDIVFDSRLVHAGSVFVAIRGQSQDGHQFLAQAHKALALVVEDQRTIPATYQGVVVEVLDSSLALQALAQNFYSHPSHHLKSLAVTGTNGKTSCTYLIEHLLKTAGMSCGVIGTIDHHLGEMRWGTQLTSPDPVTLQQRLADFVRLGADSFVIEASSHALQQNRIHQAFDVCLFTNLTRDHLDYHGDMHSYLQSKAKLFSADMLKPHTDNFAVLNQDDHYYAELSKSVQGRVTITYGQSATADFRFTILNQSLEGSQIRLEYPKHDPIQFTSPLIGLHNAYNLVGALAAIYSLGVDIPRALSRLAEFRGIPGRLQAYRPPNKRGIHSFVDYAHTPDALENVLKTMRSLMGEGQRLVCLFGCGGDRDRGKRQFMGQVAHGLSDQMIVTSDNPRSEPPMAIIKDILKGLPANSPKVRVIVDREQAIAEVVAQAQTGDIILVAGKGHESTQTINGKVHPFDDYKKLVQYFEQKDLR
jgi:UDP-N-acetylmuramoyl-L-alanyl-D-glutamate--2,6-diaminopimelate ligase